MKHTIRIFLFVLLSFALWGQNDNRRDFYFSSTTDEINNLIKQARNTDQSNPAEMLRLAKKAYDLATGINQRESMADAQVSMGVAFYLMHDYEKSLDALNTSYSEAVKYNFPDVRYFGAFSLGTLYELMNDSDKAFTYFEECRKLVEGEQTSRHAEVLKQIADLQRNNGSYGEAGKNVQEGLKIAAAAKDADLSGELSLLSGEISFQSGDTDQAIRTLLSVVNSAGDSARETATRIKALTFLARSYALTRAYSRALSYGQDALLLAGRTDNSEGRILASDALSFTYEKMGDYKKAYEYVNQYYQQKFVREQAGNEANINSIRTYYEASENEKEIGKQQQQIQNLNKMIVIGSLMLIILAALLLVFYMLYRKNSKIAEKLSRELKREMVLSKTDPLTGLPNRKDLEERITRAVANWKINKRNFSLLFLSFEEYRKMERTREAGIGDKLQKHITEALQTCLKGQDTVGVWKPFLFAILLPETDGKNLLSVQNVITQKFKDTPFIIDEEPLILSFKTGASTYEGEGNRFDCVDSCRDQIRSAST